jgi:hypothetical protein
MKDQSVCGYLQPFNRLASNPEFFDLAQGNKSASVSNRSRWISCRSFFSLPSRSPGLALTVSSLWLRGSFYGFLSILHAITVIAALLYMPFGKFFHIFQRPAQLGVKFYHAAGEKDEGALCARCGQRFASRMHVEDLRFVLRQLGFDYTMPGAAEHWQQLCPACKRKAIACAQLRMKENWNGNATTAS